MKTSRDGFVTPNQKTKHSKSKTQDDLTKTMNECVLYRDINEEECEEQVQDLCEIKILNQN